MIVNVELYSFLRFPISKGKKSESVVLFMFASLGCGGGGEKSESLKWEQSGNEKSGG